MSRHQGETVVSSIAWGGNSQDDQQSDARKTRRKWVRYNECRTCGEEGHWARDCHKYDDESLPENTGDFFYPSSYWRGQSGEHGAEGPVDLTGEDGADEVSTAAAAAGEVSVDRFGRETRFGDAPWNARAAPCLLYTSPSPRDRTRSRMPSSA